MYELLFQMTPISYLSILTSYSNKRVAPKGHYRELCWFIVKTVLLTDLNGDLSVTGLHKNTEKVLFGVSIMVLFRVCIMALFEVCMLVLFSDIRSLYNAAF